jgi:hypothetical protein
MAAGLLLIHSRHGAAAKEIANKQPSVVPVKAPEETASIVEAATTPPRSVKKQVKPKTTNSNLAAASRQFLALPGYDPTVPADELHVVRVQVPASALWQMGAPVSPDSGARKFMADFVVSQDGTPYAVRLVQ